MVFQRLTCRVGSTCGLRLARRTAIGNADKLAIVHCGTALTLGKRCHATRLAHRGTPLNARNVNRVKLVLLIRGTDNVKLDVLALNEVLVVGILLLYTDRLVVHENVLALLLRTGQNRDEPVSRLVVEPLYHAHIALLFGRHARCLCGYLSDMIDYSCSALYCFEP